MRDLRYESLMTTLGPVNGSSRTVESETTGGMFMSFSRFIYYFFMNVWANLIQQINIFDWTSVNGQDKLDSRTTSLRFHLPKFMNIRWLVSIVAIATLPVSPAHLELVLVPVTVTDGTGATITGLEREHFTLLQDNVPQN